MSERRKRYAVFVGQADENYQYRFMQGFLKSAFADNIDVCIFSMYTKYQDTAVREKGESNIFSLMEPLAFDGVVILKDSIQTANAAQNIEKRLKENFDKPVLVVENESENYPFVVTDGYQAMHDIVSHMIEVHGFTDIGYLSGKKWHKHSQQRLQAYRDAMTDHGLTVNEDRIIYGDFWYQSGEMCAEHYISNGHSLPQAIVCANDQMAIGLCKALTDRGIHVPKDVAVAGYDSTYEGQTSPMSLTSALIPADEIGAYAAQYLKDAIAGRETKPYEIMPHIVVGESCGCSEHSIEHIPLKRTSWGTEVSEEGYFSIFNKMEENLIMQGSLEDFMGTMYSYCYQLVGVKSFHLCMNDWWKFGDRDARQRNKNEGYPDRMTCAIKYSSDHKDDKIGLSDTFDTVCMLPELSSQRDKPTAFFFLPIFFEQECFGYTVMSFGNEPRSYDEDHRRWMASISRAFEALRRNLYIKYLEEKIKKHKISKFAGVSSSYELMSQEEKLDHDMVAQILDDNLLTYHFQPIVSAKDGSIYAYEALMRSTAQRQISPLMIIKYATMQGRLGDVERATFLNVLDIVDKSRTKLGNAKVFINSIPGVKLGADDRALIEKYMQKNCDAVVVELTEEAELSDKDLENLKYQLKQLGIQIAVDDYGTGYSNVSNLLRYMPHYVKIDRSLLSGIQSDSHKQHFVREIISFCHDNEILALAEGIETSDEMQTVIHLGADLIQGFYTARSAPGFAEKIDSNVISEIRAYHKEYLDGTSKKTYVAGKTNRVSLGALVKERFTDIVVGQGSMVYKDISIIGAPSLHTDINIRVQSGYSGRITLENAYLSNIKNAACIELSENCDVTLVLVGVNILKNAGICVPKSSKLVVEGDGDLKIGLNTGKYYGIGNGLDDENGEIVFEQDGTIEINSRGKSGVCIGSGKGGAIKINKGRYLISATGDICVGIGAVSNDVKIEINNSHIEQEMNVTQVIGIGSYFGNADIFLKRSAFMLDLNGDEIVGMGSFKGENASISITELKGDLNMRADIATCLGALSGSTELRVTYASVYIENAGKEAVAFGGYNENSDIFFHSADVKVNIHNLIDKDTFAPDDRIEIVNGRRKFVVNDKQIDREMKYDFT